MLQEINSDTEVVLEVCQRAGLTTERHNVSLSNGLSPVLGVRLFHTVVEFVKGGNEVISILFFSVLTEEHISVLKQVHNLNYPNSNTTAEEHQACIELLSIGILVSENSGTAKKVAFVNSKVSHLFARYIKGSPIQRYSSTKVTA